MKRLDVKVNDMVKIGDGISIKVESKTGQISRLSIIAPDNVKIELLRNRDALERLKENSIGIAGTR